MNPKRCEWLGCGVCLRGWLGLPCACLPACPLPAGLLLCWQCSAAPLLRCACRSHGGSTQPGLTPAACSFFTLQV